MGLFSGIGNLIGKGLDLVGDIVPGPIGFGAGLAGDLLSGGSKKPAIDTTGYAGSLPTLPGRSTKSMLGSSFGPDTDWSGGAGSAAAYPHIQPNGTVAGLYAADVTSVQAVKEARAPRGYRVHTVTPTTAPLLGKNVGDKVAVRLGSEAARILGVKRSKKPPISVKEWEAVKRADRAQNKAATVAKKAGLHVYRTARSTSTRKRR